MDSPVPQAVLLHHTDFPDKQRLEHTEDWDGIAAAVADSPAECMKRASQNRRRQWRVWEIRTRLFGTELMGKLFETQRPRNEMLCEDCQLAWPRKAIALFKHSEAIRAHFPQHAFIDFRHNPRGQQSGAVR